MTLYPQSALFFLHFFLICLSYDRDIFIIYHCTFVLNIPSAVQRLKTTALSLTVTATDTYSKEISLAGTWCWCSFICGHRICRKVNQPAWLPLCTANMPVLDKEPSKDLGGGEVNILNVIYIWIYFPGICIREIMFYRTSKTELKNIKKMKTLKRLKKSRIHECIHVIRVWDFIRIMSMLLYFNILFKFH